MGCGAWAWGGNTGGCIFRIPHCEFLSAVDAPAGITRLGRFLLPSALHPPT
jgi:hypothetical protein